MNSIELSVAALLNQTFLTGAAEKAPLPSMKGTPGKDSLCGESKVRANCGYRGVRKRRWGKWVSEIRQPKTRSRIWLGSYFTPQAAARAFDTAALYLRGPTTKLNFPNLPITNTTNVDGSPESIRRAASIEGAAYDQVFHSTAESQSSCAPSTLVFRRAQDSPAHALLPSPNLQPYQRSGELCGHSDSGHEVCDNELSALLAFFPSS